MTPSERPPSRPSVPYSTQTRVPTAPQRPVYDARQEQTAPPEPALSENDELEMLARRLSGGVHSAEDLIRFGFILSRKAVVETRNDESLKHVAKTGLDQSQTIMSLTGELRRSRKIIGLLIGIASGVGGIAGTCGREQQERKVEILEPIAAAEEKAERAEKKAKEVELTTEERLDATDARVKQIEDALAGVNNSLKANTEAVLGIAAKLNETPPGKKKQ